MIVVGSPPRPELFSLLCTRLLYPEVADFGLHGRISGLSYCKDIGLYDIVISSKFTPGQIRIHVTPEEIRNHEKHRTSSKLCFGQAPEGQPLCKTTDVGMYTRREAFAVSADKYVLCLRCLTSPSPLPRPKDANPHLPKNVVDEIQMSHSQS